MTDDRAEQREAMALEIRRRVIEKALIGEDVFIRLIMKQSADSHLRREYEAARRRKMN